MSDYKTVAPANVPKKLSTRILELEIGEGLRIPWRERGTALATIWYYKHNKRDYRERQYTTQRVEEGGKTYAVIVRQVDEQPNQL